MDHRYTLYVAPNTCARVPLVALEEIGAPFETRLVRFLLGEHRAPEFLAINPLGRVPALLYDGAALTENVAILRFLARKHPEARLLPSVANDVEDARQIADLCFCSSTLHPNVTRIRIPTNFADSAPAQADAWDKAVASMKAHFQLVETRLADRDWWYGEEWSIMDSYLNWCWFRVTGAGFDPSPFPRFARHAERVEKRPAVLRALLRERADQEALEVQGLAYVPPPPPNKRAIGQT